MVKDGGKEGLSKREINCSEKERRSGIRQINRFLLCSCCLQTDKTHQFGSLTLFQKKNCCWMSIGGDQWFPQKLFHVLSLGLANGRALQKCFYIKIPYKTSVFLVHWEEQWKGNSVDLVQVQPFLWREPQILMEKVEESETVSGHAQARIRIILLFSHSLLEER